MVERSHGELNAEHYREIRTNPLYRIACQMDEIAMLQEPSLNQDREEPIVGTPTEPEWTKGQWYVVNQLKAQVLFLSSKINEMRANANKKSSDFL